MNLIDRSRIRGASRVIATGTAVKDVTAEQIQQVASDVDMFCRTQSVTRQAVAEAVGYSPGKVSEFVCGTYKGAQLAIDLDEWLIEEEQRRAKRQDTEFVWTNVAR